MFKIDKPDEYTGELYLLRLHSLGPGYYKLGISKSFNVRLGRFRLSLNNVECLFLLPTRFYKSIERVLKTHYRNELDKSSAINVSGASEIFFSLDFDFNEFESLCLSCIQSNYREAAVCSRIKMIEYKRVDVGEYNKGCDFKNIVRQDDIYLYSKMQAARDMARHMGLIK